MIKNNMEILVDEIFNEISSSYKSCYKQECIDDIKSIALNNMKPKYFLSNSDEGEKKAFLLDKQRRISVMASIVEAKKTLCKNCKKKGEEA